MNILVIEDNDIKYSHVDACLQESKVTASIRRASSYQSGMEALIEGQPFDYVILDMTLPVYDAEHGIVSVNTLTFGGELILRDTLRRQIRARFIVLSQYDVFQRYDKEVTFEQLKQELVLKFGTLVVGCVKLDTTSINWKREILEIIEKL